MGKISGYIAVLIFLLFANGVYGQNQTLDSLSNDSEKFFSQLSGFLLNTKSETYKERSQKLLDRFYESWSVGKFNRDEKNAVRAVVEKMRRKKMRTFPSLYDYVYGLTLLAESNQPPKSVINWHHYLLRLLDDKKTKRFDAFLDFSRALFEKHILYDRRSFVWYYRTGRFRFDLDTTFQLKFDHLNLVVASKKDSSVFLKTKGFYDYDHKMWYGESGRLDWRRFGAEYGKKIYAVFDKYKLNVTVTLFTIDSARLYYKRFFNQPVPGRLTERVTVSPPSSRSSFPRFESYRHDFERKDIYPGIDYFGGYEIRGLKLYGKGGDDEKPVMNLYYNDKPVCKVKSELFKLGEEKINAAEATTTFYIDNDSIYHPGLHFRYSVDKNQTVFYANDNSSEPVPFYDTYHKLDLYVPAIYWDMSSDSLVFKRLRGVNPVNKAKFKSANFFSPKEFYEIQGIDEVNPMYVIYNFAHTFSTNTITVDALAGFMEKPPAQITALFVKMANKGFLVYNPQTKTATIKQRFYDFLDAKAGRIDYDVLHFNSKVIAGANASLNLKTNLLDIYGVQQVYISDSQNVYIYPYDKRVAVRKNRDFSFNGRVHAGLFDFYAHQSTFVYDSFKLSLNYVDSMAFVVKYKDTVLNKWKFEKVRNVLQNLNATIYIDKPDNKSGRKRFYQYPVLVSHDESYVYYNKKSIQDSTLWPEKFYYKVDPFVFDSLLTFSTENLQFQGELNSGDIFPVIREPLRVMPDFSLGFYHKSPKEGYPVYAGKGTFGRYIVLDNNGFMGRGKLRYLSLTTASNGVVFYPDSLFAFAWDFTGEENTNPYDFPYIDADSVFIHWDTDTNVMKVYTTENPFILYSSSNFRGIMDINPSYMKGNGVFSFERAFVSSRDIDFKHSSLTADSSDFVLSDSTGKIVEFAARGYFATIDFEKQKGWFNHLYDNTYLTFPANQYISTLDEVEWLMPEDRLELYTKANTNSTLFSNATDVRKLVSWHKGGPEFISVNPKQDSLRFFAQKAWYNIRQTSIDVEGVPFIKVADAAVFPYKKRLKITGGAHIETLQDASVIMDTVMFYHTVYDADVDITSRHNYTCDGYIDYVDMNGTKQPVRLEKVYVNDFGISTGYGMVPRDEMLFLNPYYFYYGKVGFTANRRLFRFTGAFRLNQDCTADVMDNWMLYDGEIDPQDVRFKIGDYLMGTDSTAMYFGLAYDTYEGDYYPLVPGYLKNSDDRLMVTGSGILDYDTVQNSYRISTEAGLKGSATADFLALNTKNCILYGDGVLNLDLNTPMVKVTAIGEVVHKIIPHNTELKTYLGLDFFFDKVALKTIADSLRHFYGKSVDVTKGVYPLAVKRLLGEKEGGLAMNEITLYGRLKKTPAPLKAALSFPEVQFEWDKETSSFYSKGKIAVGMVGDETLNKKLDGFLRIHKARSGDEITLLIMEGKRKWYFFSYAHHVMQFASSDMFLNDYIANLKEEKRILNPRDDDRYYEFVLTSKRKMITFLREMQEKNR